jgi:hypothetical protein
MRRSAGASAAIAVVATAAAWQAGNYYQNPAESPKSRHIFPASLGEARHSEKKCARMRGRVGEI